MQAMREYPQNGNCFVRFASTHEPVNEWQLDFLAPAPTHRATAKFYAPRIEDEQIMGYLLILKILFES